MRRRYHWLAALVGGAATALALPPIGVVPVVFLFALLLALIRGAGSSRQALFYGWCFGFAFYLTGLYWIAIAFFIEAEKFGPIAIPAVLSLTATMGLIVGLMAALTYRCRLAVPEAHALLFAVFWTLGEMVRSNPGLQFPWNPVAIVWADWPAMMQLQAWIGTPGLSFLTVFLAALPVSLIERRGNGKWLAPVVSLTILAICWGAGAWRLDRLQLTEPTGTSLRLVQPSIPQEERMRSGFNRQHFEQHLQLSGGAGNTPADLVIWAETSVPYALQTYPEVGRAIAEASPGDGWAVVGANFFENEGELIAHNSLWTVAPTGRIAGRYDKVDLVPFGEFMPFRPLFRALGVEGVAAGNIDFRAGPGRMTMALDGIPAFSPLICYEAVFSGAATDGTGRADWLLNITNDGWFGDSFGPFQHLAMARARSVEEGLPLVRTANNGISVVTDAYGRILTSLPLDAVGTIEALLPPRLAMRPFFVRNQWVVGALLVAAAALALVIDRALRPHGLKPEDGLRT